MFGIEVFEALRKSKIPMFLRIPLSCLMAVCVVLPVFLVRFSILSALTNPIFLLTCVAAFVLVAIFKRFSEYNDTEKLESIREFIWNMVFLVLPFSILYAYFPMVFIGYTVIKDLITCVNIWLKHKNLDAFKSTIAFLGGALAFAFIPLPNAAIFALYVPAVRIADHLLFGRVESFVAKEIADVSVVGNGEMRAENNIFS